MSSCATHSCFSHSKRLTTLLQKFGMAIPLTQPHELREHPTPPPSIPNIYHLVAGLVVLNGR